MPRTDLLSSIGSDYQDIVVIVTDTIKDEDQNYDQATGAGLRDMFITKGMSDPLDVTDATKLFAEDHVAGDENQVLEDKSDHNYALKPISCNECDFSALSQEEFHNHIKSDHPDVLLVPQSSSSFDVNADLTERFPCLECSYTTEDKLLLQHHNETKHLGMTCFSNCKLCQLIAYDAPKRRRLGGSAFPCLHCDYIAPFRSVIDVHTKEVHSDVKEFQCAECDYGTNNRSNFELHVDAVHLKNRRFACHLCSFRSADKSNLMKHVERIHEKLKRFACPDCDFKAYNRDHIVKHMKSKHAEKKEFNCEQCDYGAVSERLLKRHVEAIHLKIKKYSCSECNFETSYKGSFDLHNDRVHKKINNFFCSECDHKTYYKHQMNFHVRSVHKKELDFACVECNYRGASEDRLKRHVRSVHLKLKPFGCDECDFKTAHKQTVAIHKKKVHLNVRDVPCDQCDFKASTLADVKGHIIRVHGEKNLACPHCDYRTNVKASLSKHVNALHLKLKCYKCDECDFSTAYQQCLAIHIKSLHGEGQNRAGTLKVGKKQKQPERTGSDSVKPDSKKQYSCTECSFQASRRSALKMHMTIAHAGDSDQEEEHSVNKKDIAESSNHARWSYRCQECENPDISKSPFLSHIIISLNRIDPNESRQDFSEHKTTSFV